MRRTPLAITIAAALTLAACGGDDGGANPFGADADGSAGGDGSSGLDSGDGSDDGGVGQAEGGDFTVPVADGVSEVLFELGGQQQLAYPRADFERVVAFYESYADSRDNVSRSEAGDVVTWLMPDAGSGTVDSILVERDFEQSDGELITYVILVDG